MRRNILIFGGTTEGRILAEFCEEHRIPAFVSVVSGYGEQMLPERPRYVGILRGGMDEGEMLSFIRSHEIALAVDATHPYAREASANIRSASDRAGIPCLRCGREPEEEREESGDIRCVDSVREAVTFLAGTEGNVLVTTGSREAEEFTRLPGFRERLFLRVLPSSGVLKKLEDMGYRGDRIIAMQGPFTERMNAALMEDCRISVLVTKDGGRTGGYPEKIAAARKAGARIVVIRRPGEDGLPLREIEERLLAHAVPVEDREEPGTEEEREEPGTEHAKEDPVVTLAGIGPGSPGMMTVEVRNRILSADLIFGAPRMLEAAERILPEGREKPEMLPLYRPADILAALRERSGGWRRAVVLFSGDTGFCSGAAALSRALSGEGTAMEILPGISSMSYMASVTGIALDDALCVSAHGRDLSVPDMLRRGREYGVRHYMILLGGENTASAVCTKLADAGCGDWPAVLGERLSYPDERITMKSVEDMAGVRHGPLAVLLVGAGTGDMP